MEAASWLGIVCVACGSWSACMHRSSEASGDATFGYYAVELAGFILMVASGRRRSWRQYGTCGRTVSRMRSGNDGASLLSSIRSGTAYDITREWAGGRMEFTN